MLLLHLSITNFQSNLNPNVNKHEVEKYIEKEYIEEKRIVQDYLAGLKLNEVIDYNFHDFIKHTKPTFFNVGFSNPINPLFTLVFSTS